MESPNPIALVRVAAFPQFSVDPEEFRAALALAGKKASIESVLEKVPGGFAVMEAVREARHDLGQRERPVGAGNEDRAAGISTSRFASAAASSGTGRPVVRETEAAGGAGNFA